MTPDPLPGIPDHHAGRKPYVEPQRGTFASKLPEFGVRHWLFSDGDVEPTVDKVTCGRCGNYFYVPEASALGASGEARPCPFCFKASRVP